MLIKLLCAMLMVGGTVPGGQQESRPSAGSIREGLAVGAIRWDGWVPRKDPVGRAVHACLEPEKWHSRLPFFARILDDQRVELDGTSQRIVDAEIEYAASAGLDYWSFVTYPENSLLSRALDRYLSSERRSRIGFCLITEFSRWNRPEFAERVARLIREPGYQTVAGRRPLLFLGFITQEKMEAFPGGVQGFRKRLDDLRSKTTSAGTGPVYLVIMDFSPAEGAQWARLLGADAISSYATGFEPRTIPYRRLAANAQRFWEDCRRTGCPVVPTVMTGWDRRPRIERPHPWEPWQKPGEGMDRYVERAKPPEIAEHLQRALQWIHEHPADAPARAAIIYAWNEFDEGGWLAPTLAEGTARLDAISQVLRQQPTTAATGSSVQAGPSCEEVRRAMVRAVRFFAEQLAVRGGYVWEYSVDLRERLGEAEAGPLQIWVQPPGTPSVGQAFVRAWQRSGDEFCREAARRAAHALAWGQLSSGGWDYRIRFDPAEAAGYHYRRDVEAGSVDPGVRKHRSTFDDDNSQSAVRMLMEFDRASRFQDETVHRAVEYGLRSFMGVQRPNGGWPQRFEQPAEQNRWPIQPARYPETWSRLYTAPAYAEFYTLNDNVAWDLIRTLLLAYEIYGRPEYLESARRTGDFLVLARMPEPQPAWAQQYNPRMEPAWARKFEPPAIVSTESVGVIRALGELYLRTGDEKYRRPIPRFLDWLDRSRLADGRFARFYELRTNRPLYFTRDYKLVYTDGDVPTHYSFKTRFDVPGLRRWYENLPARRAAGGDGDKAARTDGDRTRPPSRQQVARAVRDLDESGRWLDPDGRIRSATFIRNLDLLSTWLQSHH